MCPAKPAIGETMAANDPAVIEQALYWASIGMTPAEALEQLRVSWYAVREPGWGDVQYAIAAAWRKLNAEAGCSSSAAARTHSSTGRLLAPVFSDFWSEARDERP